MVVVLAAADVIVDVFECVAAAAVAVVVQGRLRSVLIAPDHTDVSE